MAKVTDQFQNTIQEELKRMAQTDTLLNSQLKDPKKSIKECTAYILDQVKESGKLGFADEEIFGMAKHYYITKDIKIKNKNLSADIRHSSFKGTKGTKAKSTGKKAEPKKPASKPKPKAKAETGNKTTQAKPEISPQTDAKAKGVEMLQQLRLL